MAKSRKTDQTDIDQIEAVDLITLLTPPGCDGLYEAEIAAPENDQEFDLLAFAATIKDTALPSPPPETPTKPKPQERSKPTQTSDETYEALKLATAPAAGKSSLNRASGSARLQPIPEIPGDSLEKIASEIAVCQKCELCKTRNKTVPGVGNPKARLVFIGEAPGADEDATGIPFVGKAGQHLDKILAAAGFKRDEVFICNILKCRPPENRDPNISEMTVCTPYLQRQLRLLKPDLIACLGNIAIKFVIGPETPGITRIHGQWFTSIFGVPTMAMYHPSYLIRSATREKGSPNWQMWQDIQALKTRYDKLG